MEHETVWVWRIRSEYELETAKRKQGIRNVPKTSLVITQQLALLAYRSQSRSIGKNAEMQALDRVLTRTRHCIYIVEVRKIIPKYYYSSFWKLCKRKGEVLLGYVIHVICFSQICSMMRLYNQNQEEYCNVPWSSGTET